MAEVVTFRVREDRKDDFGDASFTLPDGSLFDVSGALKEGHGSIKTSDQSVRNGLSGILDLEITKTEDVPDAVEQEQVDEQEADVEEPAASKSSKRG